MRITIDTKHDGHDDILKVMEILCHFVKRDENNPVVDTTNLMGMFSENNLSNNNPEIKTETKNNIPDTPPDFTSFLNLAQQKKDNKKDDGPKIEFF